MNKRARGYLITIFASIAWGFSGVCSEFLMKEYHADPYWLTAIRMLLAAPTTMAFLLIKDRGISELHKKLLHNRRSYLPMVIYSVFGLAASQLTYVVAIGYSNAGTATVIEFLGPILIVLFVCITARRLPKYTELFAIFFALFGTFILATHGKIDSLVISTQALNWGLASAIGFALYTLIPVKLIRRYGSELVVAYGFIIGGIILGLIVRVWNFSITWDLMSILAMSGLVIIGTTFAFSLFLQGVGDIGPVRASLISCLQPISAAFFSFLLVGTQFTLLDISGMALILAGVIIVSLKDLISLKRSSNHERQRLRQRSGHQ